MSAGGGGPECGARPRIRISIDSAVSEDRADGTKVCADALHAAAAIAATDVTRCAEALETAAGGARPTVLVEVSRLLLKGRLGRVGERSASRAVANQLLERALSVLPTHTAALCLLGESMLPAEHGGLGGICGCGAVNCNHAPERAYDLFVRAATLGCPDATFLQGRFMVTTAREHGSCMLTERGMQLMRLAATQGVARAHVFLAAMREYPGRYAPVIRSKRTHGQRRRPQKTSATVILDMYVTAAESGDAAAINDVGSALATGYAGLSPSFTAASQHFARAARHGYLPALDNLGRHLETGMDGQAPQHIDTTAAAHIFEQGALLRSPGCAYSLAKLCASQGNIAHAQNYYQLALWLSDDERDFATCSAIFKDLMALAVVRLKCAPPQSGGAIDAQKCLLAYLGEQSTAAMLADVDEALFKGLRGRRKKLNLLLGTDNATLVLQRARAVLADNDSNHVLPEVEHVFGRRAKQATEGWRRNNGKGGAGRPLRIRKRRKTL